MFSNIAYFWSDILRYCSTLSLISINAHGLINLQFELFANTLFVETFVKSIFDFEMVSEK